jgi:hypothetical protein
LITLQYISGDFIADLKGLLVDGGRWLRAYSLSKPFKSTAVNALSSFQLGMNSSIKE